MLDAGGLDQINTLPRLLDYLREHCEWPIEEEDFENLVFDWDPRELGLKEADEYADLEIKQLRPLTSNQPWGIFFVNFPKKDLKVTILRRILGALTVKRRKSANAGERAAWQKHDLLFLSAFGESGHRQLAFAHFQDDDGHSNLPRLDVLGWDADDTVRKLSKVTHRLQENLRWPVHGESVEEWRRRWSAALDERPHEAISTSKRLAEALALLAQRIRDRTEILLGRETDEGALTKLCNAFKEALIHDLTPRRFADMYAQTITYGLLLARISRQSGALTADDAPLMAPSTNPFLRDLLETFLKVGGRKGGMDFDELGVNDVVELLRQARMDLVLDDFNNRNPEEDPVIHFYESFLKEYDPKERIQRGVFYTPRPVVSFIVRSVDEVLRRDFKLEDGLADIATWGEMEKRLPGLKRPKGVNANEPFVRILDPATGTGTFVVEVIDLIHNRMVEKWKVAGKSRGDIEKLWNDYVPRHLLSRLYAFELMMAPYAIAHMKVGLKLFDTGYKFGSKERARIFLTNALEPAQDLDMQLAFMSEALAHEAKAANDAKNVAFTVIYGNPPYSLASQNLSPNARKIVEPYRFSDGQKIKERGALQAEKIIQDDYVKFFRTAESYIERTSLGVVGLVTNHSYIDGPVLRGMRNSLVRTFSKIWCINLHGSSSKNEVSPLSSKEGNVFDIVQGVAIFVGERHSSDGTATVKGGDLWGPRTRKYEWLTSASVLSDNLQILKPVAPMYLLKPSSAGTPEYPTWPALNEIFAQSGMGIVTARDQLVVGFEPAPLVMAAREFRDSTLSNKALCDRLGISEKKGWDIKKARSSLKAEKHLDRFVRDFDYRPFDTRKLFYHRSLVWGMSLPTMQNMLDGENIAIASTRTIEGGEFKHIFAMRHVAGHHVVSLKEVNTIFPLWLKTENDGGHPTSNIRPAILRTVSALLDRKKAQGSGEAASDTITPEQFFHWLYAVLHSAKFRQRYADSLKSDFARVPLPATREIFHSLVPLGQRLVTLHALDEKVERLLKDPKDVRFAGRGTAFVEKGYPTPENGRVKINTERWFEDVPEKVWSFHIGGYQVCEKWLKDRQMHKLGRALNESEILHYRRIVTAISETIDLMAEIDRVIDHHGGWPGAFKGMTDY